MKCACGCEVKCGLFSRIVALMPILDSRAPRVRPVGPAPTTTTSEKDELNLLAVLDDAKHVKSFVDALEENGKADNMDQGWDACCL